MLLVTLPISIILFIILIRYPEPIPFACKKISPIYNSFFLSICNPTYSLKLIIFPLPRIILLFNSFSPITIWDTVFPLSCINKICFIVHDSISMRLLISYLSFIHSLWKLKNFFKTLQLFLSILVPMMIVFLFSFLLSYKGLGLILNLRLDLNISLDSIRLFFLFKKRINRISQSVIRNQLLIFDSQVCFRICIVIFKPFLNFFLFKAVTALNHDWILHNLERYRAYVLFRDFIINNFLLFHLANYIIKLVLTFNILNKNTFIKYSVCFLFCAHNFFQSSIFYFSILNFY